MKCPLCGKTQFKQLQHVHLADVQIFHCQVCDLIFKSPNCFLSPMEEKSRYELHLNSEEDLGYIAFLSPIVQYLENTYDLSQRKSLQILDYGSGPNPVLASILKKKDFQVEIFDLYFAPGPEVLTKTFDVIISTEVVEHFYRPEFDFTQIRKALRDGGELVVMTGLHPGPEKFTDWWYARDPSHVVFYSRPTMTWIQEHWQFAKLTVNPTLSKDGCRSLQPQ